MFPASLLAERLVACRRALDYGEPGATLPAHVAERAGLPVVAVERLEQTGAGTAAELATLLTFYVQQNLNLRWALLPDNAELPPYLFVDYSFGSDFTRAEHLARELSQHVQQTVLEILVNLTPALPLDRYTPDELRTYQAALPPVRAARAGWQSRVRTLYPAHYYAAGETVPACGDIGQALLYDELPPAGRVPEKSRCAACRRRRAADEGRPEPATPSPRSPKVRPAG